MTVMTERAMAPDQVDEAKPYRALYIGNKLVEKTGGISFSQGENGSSELSITADLDLERLENAPVRFITGYSDERTEYFSGHIVDPSYDPRTGIGTATAFDPFNMLTRQHLQRDWDFREESSEIGIYTILQTSLLEQRRIEIRGARKHRFTEYFGEEITLDEALSAIIDPIEYVKVSRPGYGGIVMPSPGPGSTAKRKAVYTPRHYPPEGFSLEKDTDFYSQVVVFRRDNDGQYLVRARETVENKFTSLFPPTRNRSYYITDFTGTQGEAEILAYNTSIRLREGTWKWGLEGIAWNPDLLFYDTIEIRRAYEDQRTGIEYEEAYSCQIDGSGTGESSIDVFNMSLSGRAVRLWQREIKRPQTFITSRLSQGIVPKVAPVPPTPTGVTWDDLRTFEELGHYTFEEIS